MAAADGPEDLHESHVRELGGIVGGTGRGRWWSGLLEAVGALAIPGRLLTLGMAGSDLTWSVVRARYRECLLAMLQ